MAHMIVTPLVVNVSSRNLVISREQPTAVSVPLWYAGDVKQLRVQLVQNAASGTGKAEVIAATGLALELSVALGPTQTVVASAVAGTADASHWWSATLDLRDQSVITAMSGNLESRFDLEFKVKDGSSPQRFTVPITIRKNITGEVTPTLPAAPERALSEGEIEAKFETRVKPKGYFTVWTDDAGVEWAMSVGTDGIMRGVRIN